MKPLKGLTLGLHSGVAIDAYGVPCIGADKDAYTGARLMGDCGFEAKVLTDENATSKRVSKAFQNHAHNIGNWGGGLLVWTHAGHGGQVPDESGDEADGLDETLHFYDVAVSDDAIAALLGSVPNGVRVFMLVDTCNSETMHRSAPIKRNAWSPARAMERSAFTGELIVFSGCGDGESSYGGSGGGHWTNACDKAFRTLAKDNPIPKWRFVAWLLDRFGGTEIGDTTFTYEDWFNMAAGLMGGNQEPHVFYSHPHLAGEIALT